MQFRFQVIDKIPTKESQARQRGTLVHAALENLFDLPAQQRTFAAASRTMEEAWDKTLSEKPDLLAELFGEDKSGENQFLETARQLLANYFQMENPDRLAPAHREKYLRVTDKNHLHLHGYIDRVDISPTGLVRIVDYKTGKAPAERYIGPIPVPNSLLCAAVVLDSRPVARPLAAAVPKRPAGLHLYPHRCRY